MRRACALLVLAAATPAAAHRLDYADVLSRGRGSTMRPSRSPRRRRPTLLRAGRAGGEPAGAQLLRRPLRDRARGQWLCLGHFRRDWRAGAPALARHRGQRPFGEGLDYVEGQVLYSHPVSTPASRSRPGSGAISCGRAGPMRCSACRAMSSSRSISACSASSRPRARSPAAPMPITIGSRRRASSLQPFAGLSASAEDVPALGLGHGLNSAELGLRLRYRIAEPFAPYLGVRYDRLLGRTAELARQAGDDIDDMAFLLGFRSYF